MTAPAVLSAPLLAAPVLGAAPLLGASTAELSLRMVVSLSVMGLAALVVMKLARGRLRLGGARADIAVHARHQLTRNASVAVIRAGERWLLVGVTDTNVTVLAEGDDLAADPSAAASSAAGSSAVATSAGPLPPPVAEGSADDLRPPADRRPGAGSAHHRARAADGAARRGAGKRHRRATESGPGRSRTSLIEALREKTVRR